MIRMTRMIPEKSARYMGEKLLLILLLLLFPNNPYPFLFFRGQGSPGVHGPHGAVTVHHSLKKMKLLLRAPVFELFVCEQAPDLHQVFNGLLLQFGLSFNPLEMFGPDGFCFDGGIGEKFTDFESFGDELSPEELCLPEVGLLKEVETF